MQRLFPAYADTVNLAAAYAYPNGQPWLRANMVASVDGAAAVGDRSGGLSGRADRLVFGTLRGLADAVVVGASTVRIEGYGPARPKPELAAFRAELGQTAVPVIAVVSGTLDLDPSATLFTDASVRTIVLTAASAPTRRRHALERTAEVLTVGTESVDPGLAIESLHQRGLTRLLCEGGPTLLAGVSYAGCLDELCLTVSPGLVGGGAPRVLAGDTLRPPLRMRLAHVLEEDSFLFLRYDRS